MRKLFFIILLLIIYSHTYAQMEGSVFSATGRGGVATTFVTDYQTIGINPANLGFNLDFRDPKFTMGFLESNISITTEALDRKELFGTIFNSSTTTFNVNDKENAVQTMSNTLNNINADVMLLGVSWKMPKKLGGLAISIRDRISTTIFVTETAADIAFFGATSTYFPQLQLSDGTVIDNPRINGGELTDDQLSEVARGTLNTPADAQTYSNLLDGTEIKSSWFREYNLSYGVQLVDHYDFSLFAGVGARYIQGLLNLNFEASNGELSPTFSSSFINPSDVLNATSLEGVDQSAEDNRSYLSKLLFPDPSGTGKGVGLDLGFTMIVKKNLRIGASITNVGSMTWNGEVYTVQDGVLVQFVGQGFDNYNLLASNEGAFQFAGSEAALNWEQKTTSETVDLPTVARLGISYELYKLIHFGVDVIYPMNDSPGNLEKPLIAFGGDFRANRIFTFSTGVNLGGNNGDVINWPIGFTFHSRKGKYEAGISTRDIKTFFIDTGLGSTFSLAGGFLRFKI